jgi:hypothetical protein
MEEMVIAMKMEMKAMEEKEMKAMEEKEMKAIQVEMSHLNRLSLALSLMTLPLESNFTFLFDLG